MHLTEIKVSHEKKLKFVSSLNDALCDQLKEHLRSLYTQNSGSTSAWDLINTNLFDNLNTLDCLASKTRRGSWTFVPVFDEEEGVLYTFMREKRYEEILKNQKKGKNRNYYVTHLVERLNSDLISPNKQMCLLQQENTPDEKAQNTLRAILRDLQIAEGKIKRHALILFEARDFELFSVRAVIVDRHLEIVCEEDWSSYIVKNESIIMNAASTFAMPSNNPSHGLQLSPKSRSRKKPLLSHKKLDNEKKYTE